MCTHIRGPQVDGYLYVLPVKFRCVCVCVCVPTHLFFPVSLGQTGAADGHAGTCKSYCTKIFLDCCCYCEERPSEKNGFCSEIESKGSDDSVVLGPSLLFLGAHTDLSHTHFRDVTCQQPSCPSDNTPTVCVPSAGKSIPTHTPTCASFAALLNTTQRT